MTRSYCRRGAFLSLGESTLVADAQTIVAILPAGRVDLLKA